MRLGLSLGLAAGLLAVVLASAGGAPAPATGRYEGTTGQGLPVAFDVSERGLALDARWRASCPGSADAAEGRTVRRRAVAPVASDGSFSWRDSEYEYGVDGDDETTVLKLDGRVRDGSISGTWRVEQRRYGGQSDQTTTCASGDVSVVAGRRGAASVPSLVTRDPGGELSVALDGGGDPALGVGAGGVWVSERKTRTRALVSRFDRSGRGPTGQVEIRSSGGLAVGRGAVWSSGPDGLLRIDARTMRVRRVTRSGDQVWVGTSGVWTQTRDGIAQLNARNGRVVRRIRQRRLAGPVCGERPGLETATVGRGALWLGFSYECGSRGYPGRVVRVNGRTGRVAQLPLRRRTFQEIVAGSSGLWGVLVEPSYDGSRGTLQRLDPSSGAVRLTRRISGLLSAGNAVNLIAAPGGFAFIDDLGRARHVNRIGRLRTVQRLAAHDVSNLNAGAGGLWVLTEPLDYDHQARALVRLPRP